MSRRGTEESWEGGWKAGLHEVVVDEVERGREEDIGVPKQGIGAQGGEEVDVPREDKEVEEIKSGEGIKDTVGRSVIAEADKPYIGKKRKDKHDKPASDGGNHKCEIAESDEGEHEEIEALRLCAEYALFVMPCHVCGCKIDREADCKLESAYNPDIAGSSLVDLPNVPIIEIAGIVNTKSIRQESNNHREELHGKGGHDEADDDEREGHLVASAYDEPEAENRKDEKKGCVDKRCDKKPEQGGLAVVDEEAEECVNNNPQGGKETYDRGHIDL